MSICLLLLILIPLVGAAVGAMLPSNAAKIWALVVGIATAIAAVAIVPSFNFKQNPTVAATEKLQKELDAKIKAGDAEPGDKPRSPTGLETQRASFQFEFPASKLQGQATENPDTGEITPPKMQEDNFALSSINLHFHLGLDSISFFLVLLTVLLLPPALLASFGSIKERQKEYYAWMLVLLAAMNGVFLARDLLLFYIFFELTLIPMFFIIGIWGGQQRRYAALKFFLFTFGGSIFTLVGVVYIGLRCNTFDISEVVRIAQSSFTPQEHFWLLLAFLAGFAVKVPLFPVHTWLPLAHTEAPTAGSVILAGVLLKLGTYGLLRLAVPIGLIGWARNPNQPDPNKAHFFLPLFDRTVYEGFLFPKWHLFHYSITMPGVLKVLAVLCLIGILYGALVAWVQLDIKKLVAYSSVSHLGFCVLGLFALNAIGMQGSVLYMINHGLSTGAMFLVIGMIYDRFHTRDINELSGLAKIMPKMAFFFVFFMLSSIGLPGLNGFVSEFLTVLGAFKSDYLGIPFGAVAAIGVILGALYMLHMTARVIFGPLKYPGSAAEEAHDVSHGHADAAHGAHAVSDIGAREIGLLIPLAIAVVVLGVLPRGITMPIAPGIELIRTPIENHSRSRRGMVDNAAPSVDLRLAAAAHDVEAQ